MSVVIAVYEATLSGAEFSAARASADPASTVVDAEVREKSYSNGSSEQQRDVTHGTTRANDEGRDVQPEQGACLSVSASTMDNGEMTDVPVTSNNMSFLLESGKFSDVSFVYTGEDGQRKVFEAHRNIVAINSPVFESILFGQDAERKEVLIPLDVKPSAFAVMLRYFYTDKAQLQNLEEAFDCCYVSIKYKVSNLKSKCTQYILESMTAENACMVYEKADELDLNYVANVCRQIFSIHTKEVITSQSFKSSKICTVIAVIDSPSLAVPSEGFLLTSVIDWGLRECSRRGTDAANIRTVLDPLIPHIKFVFVLPERLIETCEKYGVPTFTELCSLVLAMSSPATPLSKLPEIFATDRPDDREFQFQNSWEMCLQKQDTANSLRYIRAPDNGFVFKIRVKQGSIFVHNFVFHYMVRGCDRDDGTIPPTIPVKILFTVPGRLNQLSLAKQLPVKDQSFLVTLPRHLFLDTDEKLIVELLVNYYDIHCAVVDANTHSYKANGIEFDVTNHCCSDTMLCVTIEGHDGEPS